MKNVTEDSVVLIFLCPIVPPPAFLTYLKHLSVDHFGSSLSQAYIELLLKRSWWL